MPHMDTTVLDEETCLSSTSSFIRRKAVSSPHIDTKRAQDFRPRTVPKSPEELKELHTFLLDNCLFVHLDEQGFTSLLEAMEKLQFKSGQVIIQQGKKGENFHVVGSGQVGVVINGERVSRIRKGGTFGELELMYDTPCAATLVAESDEVTIWALDRNTYQLLVVSVFISKHKEYEELLARVPIFQELTAHERSNMADALTQCNYGPGEYVVRYGEEGDWLYIVEEGSVELIGRTLDQQPVKVLEMTDGGWFGDLEFVNNHMNVVDAVAKGPLKVVKLNRYHIELCMGTLREMLKRNMQNPSFEYYREKMLARTIRYIGRGGRRRAPVSSESYEPYDASFPLQKVPKSEAEMTKLWKRLEQSPLFDGFQAEELQAAVDAMVLQTYQAGDMVARQGEMETYFFIVESGQYTTQVDDEEPVPLKAGQSFGEMELLYGIPCQATVQAVTAGGQWAIDRSTYRHLAMKGQFRRRQRAEDLLRPLPAFQEYSAYQCLIVAETMQVNSYGPKDIVMQCSQHAKEAYLLLEGVLDLEDTLGQSLGPLTCKDYPLLGVQEISYGIASYQVTAQAATQCRIGIIPASQMPICFSPILYEVPPNPAQVKQYYATLAATWPPRRVGHNSYLAGQ